MVHYVYFFCFEFCSCQVYCSGVDLWSFWVVLGFSVFFVFALYVVQLVVEVDIVCFHFLLHFVVNYRLDDLPIVVPCFCTF